MHVIRPQDSTVQTAFSIALLDAGRLDDALDALSVPAGGDQRQRDIQLGLFSKSHDKEGQSKQPWWRRLILIAGRETCTLQTSQCAYTARQNHRPTWALRQLLATSQADENVRMMGL